LLCADGPNPISAQAVLERLKDSGRLYVMGDTDQQLYERETFDLTDAVHVTCIDNFPLVIFEKIFEKYAYIRHYIERKPESKKPGGPG
jgi:hypothetical protein